MAGLRRHLPREFGSIGSLAAAALCLAAAGCGGRGYDVAPVSGTVTLDQRPVAGVHVGFQPMAPDEEHLRPGPGSYGTTDENGRFRLEVVEPAQPGAVVGRHRVRFALSEEMPAVEDDVGQPTKPRLADRFLDGSITFDVPRGGTDHADFELESP